MILQGPVLLHWVFQSNNKLTIIQLHDNNNNNSILNNDSHQPNIPESINGSLYTNRGVVMFMEETVEASYTFLDTIMILISPTFLSQLMLLCILMRCSNVYGGNSGSKLYSFCTQSFFSVSWPSTKKYLTLVNY